jgi:hypothetical protein
MAGKQVDSIYYFRFILEIIALVFIGWYGSNLASGWISFFLAAGFVFAAMLLWGIFNVPGDPSRSGKAPVVVSGVARLAIEASIFLFASYAINTILGLWFALLFLVALMAHYIQTKNRVQWLLKQ